MHTVMTCCKIRSNYILHFPLEKGNQLRDAFLGMMDASLFLFLLIGDCAYFKEVRSRSITSREMGSQSS